jgi:hypothetical protein
MDEAARHVSLLGCVAAIATVLLTTSASAAPEAVDLELNVGAGTTQQPPLSPNGTTLNIAKRNFIVTIEIALITPLHAKAKVRVELGGGLTWGADAPDPTEQCTSTTSTGECQTGELQPVTGGSSGGWFWDVVAPQNGTYTFRAEIVEASDTDPNPANNASAVTIVVNEAATPPPPPPPAPVVVRASTVRLSAAKPKAGSAVAASVRVMAGGTPIKPSKVACSGTVGGAKLAGKPRAAVGRATCTYRPPKTAKGKRLRGAISFTARGTRFTKRFSATLR